MLEVVMVTVLLTHDCMKWFQYLQDHNSNFRQKIIPKFQEQDQAI